MWGFFPGVWKFNDDSDRRWCHEQDPSRGINKPQMSSESADDQHNILELQKFIEDLSQIPEKTPVVSEIEGMGTR